MDIEKINIELATKTPFEIVQWAITNAQTPILTTNFRPYESAILHLVTTVNPSIKVIGVDAYGSVLKKYHETRKFDANEIYPYRIEGLGKNLIPTATDFDVIDEFIKVADEESAHSARELSTTEGLFAGYTSGAVIQAVKQLNEIGVFKPEDIVVLIFPDHGSRYMSKVYNDQWMEDQGFFDNSLNVNVKPIEFIK